MPVGLGVLNGSISRAAHEDENKLEADPDDGDAEHGRTLGD
jgi:hypothetical protein